MDNTRIFVKNLPSNLTVEQYRKHFSQQAIVTDAKFLPKKRIGYVGYKTPEDAKRAIIYFNKSYIGSSRLSVEYAKAIGSVELRPTKRQRLDAVYTDRNDTSAASQAIETPGDVKDKQLSSKDRKIQEFLGLTRSGHKALINENEDLRLIDTVAEEPSTVSIQIQQPKPALAESPPVKQLEQTDPDYTITSEVVQGQAEPNILVPSKGDDGTLAPNDSTWVRNRTSRLLDLVEDEDDQAVIERIKTDEDEIQLASGTQIQSGNDPTVSKKQDDAPTPISKSQAFKPTTNKIFIRNLSYGTTLEDLRSFLLEHGVQDAQEIQLPMTSTTNRNKGFAHVRMASVHDADVACEVLDQSTLQGRLIHVMPSSAPIDDFTENLELGKLSYRDQAQAKRKRDATSSKFNWNSMYMNADAIISSVASRLGVSKTDVLDPTSSSAAVKQALAETHVIQETKAYFTAHGVNITNFQNQKRGGRALLVKNFPFGTSTKELGAIFETHGPLQTILMPPAGTIAIVVFTEEQNAQSAFKGLAYRKFKDSLLYLELAPLDLWHGGAGPPTIDSKEEQPKVEIGGHHDSAAEKVDGTTLYVRNLNFSTSSEQLRDTFGALDGFVSATVKTKRDPKREGQTLSMGFGFAEFASKESAAAAIQSMNGYKLDGFDLIVQPSNRQEDAVAERSRTDRLKKERNKSTKIVVKNLPFEVSKKDLRVLLESHGQLRSLRMPKKFDNSLRGFAFAEFLTSKEAEAAMLSLHSTHILGRRLVLQYASAETDDPEEEIKLMQEKASRQSEKAKLQQMISGSARRKFAVEGGEPMEGE